MTLEIKLPGTEGVGRLDSWLLVLSIRLSLLGDTDTWVLISLSEFGVSSVIGIFFINSFIFIQIGLTSLVIGEIV